MRIVEALLTLPDGRVIRYHGELHHRTIGWPEDRHTVSGDLDGLPAPPELTGWTAGPENVESAVQEYALLVGATVSIWNDGGELEGFPELEGVQF
ncbi:hypothetical protein [Leptonema illini]|uniref:Uncharacterized protein n=1 Tax=Leptonema illini DSM 21528 TaxID=929563 RepID=H2CA18_9LEPT|nr:hypothetical protein [Leptonema illini]EHQ05142.1 hypothetical protein Lepil_0436 [Leptonema illini DSM 21528]